MTEDMTVKITDKTARTKEAETFAGQKAGIPQSVKMFVDWEPEMPVEKALDFLADSQADSFVEQWVNKTDKAEKRKEQMIAK